MRAVSSPASSPDTARQKIIIMRWKTKEKKPSPKIGLQRFYVDIAIFPVKTDDGQTIWLERYLVCEEYREYVFDFGGPGWVIIGHWSQASTMWGEWHEKI